MANQHVNRRFDFTTELTQDDDGRSSIADFLILRATEFNHALCSWMGNFNLPQDGMPVVGEHDASHRVEQHLQHGLGAKT